MANLRYRVEADLATTLESDNQFGLPVVLIDPDGNRVDQSVHGGALFGQVLYETVRVNPDTGEEMVINNPVVTLRRSSLARVPAAGEKWLVKIPVDPTPEAAVEDFIFDSTRAPGGSRSIGFIVLYLRRAVQSV